MSVDKFKDDLIKHLVAALHDVAPERCAKLLKRHGFQANDVTFRRTKNSKRTWTEIWRWPWGSK